MNSVKSPLRYHGGKSKLAKWIVSQMPPHDRYVEAYAGGMSVLFAKPCGNVSEFVNDLNGELMNFWSVLRDQNAFDRFRRIVEATPLSSELFEKSKEKLKSFHFRDVDCPDVDCAVNYFIVMRQSRQGLGKDYCTPTQRLRRGMNEQVSAWLSSVEGLPEVHARLKRVELRRQGAISLIKELDNEGTLFYLDPPYLKTTRNGGDEYGDFEMSDVQHAELLGVLAQIQGKFILSGYPSEMYDFAADLNGWRCIEVEVVAASSSKQDKKNDLRKECLWLNFDPETQT